MKHTFPLLSASLLLALALVGSSQNLFAQTSVQTITADPATVQQSTTTTTSAGTISAFSPDSIVVTTQDSPQPVHYTYSKSTTYVDESGNAVSMDTVKSGLPVTVYYVKDGDNLVASKVIVRKTVTVPAANVQDSQSTTTTTTNK